MAIFVLTVHLYLAKQLLQLSQPLPASRQQTATAAWVELSGMKQASHRSLVCFALISGGLPAKTLREEASALSRLAEIVAARQAEIYSAAKKSRLTG